MNIFRNIRNRIFYIKCNIPMMKWNFRHWVFRWNVDDDGDIVFSIMNIVHFIKYKQSTIINFGKRKYKEAPKYIGINYKDQYSSLDWS